MLSYFLRSKSKYRTCRICGVIGFCDPVMEFGRKLGWSRNGPNV